MTWHPAKVVTVEQRARAVELLPQWEEGKVWEENGVQYRAAWHPSHEPGGPPHHGIEVWLPEVPAPMTTTTPVRATDDEKKLVLAEGEKRGWPAAELDAAIQIESGWQPHISNPSTNAGGLIGFMPFILRQLGWTGSPESFRAQSAAAQAPWVGKYFDLVGKKWRFPGDTYVALAASSYVGAPDSTVVYQRGSKAWELNPGWRGADGEITAGSIRALLLRRMAGGHAQPGAPKEPPPGSYTPFSAFWERLHSVMVPAGPSAYWRPPVAVAAVLADYQRARGLAIDGVMGPETVGQFIKDAARGLIDNADRSSST